MISKRFQLSKQLLRTFYSSLTNTQADPAAQQKLSSFQIADLINSKPELKKYDPTLLHRTFEIMCQQGFTSTNFLNIIRNHEKLITRSPEKIFESIECWRSAQFGEKSTIALLESYPELFDYQNELELQHKIGYFLPYALTRKNIWRIMMNAPNVLSDRNDLIETKIKYVKMVMKAELSDVVKSTVFSRSLDEIMTRHMFLDRLGLYKARSAKAEAMEPNLNPRMHQIYDTDDETFAKKICGISLEEWEVFQALYKREIDKMDLEFIDDEEYFV